MITIKRAKETKTIQKSWQCIYVLSKVQQEEWAEFNRQWTGGIKEIKTGSVVLWS